MKKEKTSTMDAFPMAGNREWDPCWGMNYRQWLIGMAMQGAAASGNYPRWEAAARDAIGRADAVCQMLDEEAGG